ncbi:UDP-N-acetylmuramyl-tripeptide synthetase [sediment metagenome]|uniref:UDP-N-acetylmuramyl-tripeptide synthetase n=1 Tax=sediment metagenome TaxID=749907 RepID=D9PIE7_9ZZZZ
MKLKDLITGMEILSVNGDVEKDITDIAYHSSRVGPGVLFAAIKGLVSDGHDFINEAVAKGARAVVSEKENNINTTQVIVKDSRAALARISSKFFGQPSNKLKLIGVTGTNGKTTITYLLESIFKEAGLSAGVIGTVEHRFNGQRIKSSNTTPESYDLQKLFKEMVVKGVGACAMEVSSHALTLERVAGCNFDGAIFTNLSPEHLDFHNDMESYFESKMRLFREYLDESGKKGVFAAINADDTYGKKLAANVGHKILSYSLNGAADVYAKEVKISIDGIEMCIAAAQKEFTCRSELIGRFNAYNIMAAASGAIGLGIDIDVISRGIGEVHTVPGRLEKIANKRGVLAFVDYAHTPDALENVLVNMRELMMPKNGRLIVVFGCGGDRDRAKRPLMGKIASENSDIAIITSDNPRSENPNTIIREIVSGVTNRNYEVINERRIAIHHVAKIAKEGDVVIVAGKGHEDYQIVGLERRHFDDREVLKEYLI